MFPFISRILHYVADRVIVHTLANNPTFQRFALKIDSFLHSKSMNWNTNDHIIKNTENIIKENINKINENISSSYTTSGGSKPISNNSFNFQKFLQLFQEEIKRDFQNK